MTKRVVWMIVFMAMGMHASASPAPVGVALVLKELVAALSTTSRGESDVDEKEASPAYKAQPIPCGEDAPTLRSYREQVFIPFAREQFGLPNDAEDDATKRVSVFLEEQFWFMQQSRLCDQWPVWQEAARLAQSGCAHPVLDWMLAMEAIVLSKKPDKALTLLKELEAKAEGAPNRTFLRLLVADGVQRAKPSKEHDEALSVAAVEWLKEVLQNPKHSRCAMETLKNFVSVEQCEVFQSYLPQIEPMDRWFFLTARGDYAIKKAWKERGTGWASSVTPEGWKGFAEWLSAARTDLEEAWQMRPELPSAAVLMVTVSGGDGRDDIRMWFDRAVAAECDYEEAYRHFLWFSRPRWRGSIQGMRSFAEECYSTRRFDTLIPYYYVYAMLTVSEEQYGRWQDVVLENGVFEKSCEVLNALRTVDWISQERRDLSNCILAMMYWAVGDLDAAIEANKGHHGHCSGSATVLVGNASYYSITRMLEVLGSNPPAELTELARRCLKREFDGTEDLIETLRKEKTRRTAIVPLSLIANFSNAGWDEGLWRDLQIPGKFDGWVNHTPGFRTQQQAYAAGARLAMVSLGVPVPENLEIECKVAFEKGTDDASFAIVLDDPTLTRQGAPTVRLSRKDGQVVADIEDVTEKERHVAWREDGESAEVRIVSKNNRISLFVDGTTIFDSLNANCEFRLSNRDKTRGLQIMGQRCRFEGLKIGRLTK